MGLPAFPKYGKDSLRPNPSTADPSKGDLAYCQETILVGDFGDWGASPTVVNGLAKPGKTTPKGKGLDSEVTKPPKNIRRPLY
jgi:hypothetical protein